MSILRIKKVDNYTIIANHCFGDERLSYRAIGLLCYLLSKPNDWEVRTSELVKSHKEGRDAVLATITELGQFGYVTRQKGFGEVTYIVHEVPVEVADYQEPDYQATDYQATDKPTLLRTELDQGLNRPRTESPREAKSAGNQGNAIAESRTSRKEPNSAPQVQIAADPPPPAPTKKSDLQRFFIAYPEHRRNASRDAIQQAWNGNTNRPPIDAILFKLEEQKKSEQWTKQGGQFIPGIVNYITGSKWNDPVFPPERKTQADWNSAFQEGAVV